MSELAAGIVTLQDALETARSDVTWNEKQLADARKSWEKQQRYFEQAEQRLNDARERVSQLTATLNELGVPARETERS